MNLIIHLLTLNIKIIEITQLERKSLFRVKLESFVTSVERTLKGQHVDGVLGIG